jgi:glycosyltransferase involved in cell wall biosynthesis
MLAPRRRLLPLYVCDLRLGRGAVSQAIERVSAASARMAVSRAARHCVLSIDYATSSRVVGDRVDRAIAVHPPIDAWRYEPRPGDALAARLGVEGRPVVGFVGRIVFEKGLPVLIAAMRMVREAVPGAVLVIVGDSAGVAGGGMADELRREVGDDPDVILTGRLSDDDLLAFYGLCDVVALPSVDPLEAFGMVQVEAMLCGTPVVASDLPGVRLPVRTTGMGRLAPPGDAAGLAASLVEVLRDPAAVTAPRESVMRAFDPAMSYDAMATAVAATAEA